MQISGSHADSLALTSPSASCGTAEAVPFVQQHNSKLVGIQPAANQQKQPDFVGEPEEKQEEQVAAAAHVFYRPPRRRVWSVWRSADAGPSAWRGNQRNLPYGRTRWIAPGQCTQRR